MRISVFGKVVLVAQCEAPARPRRRATRSDSRARLIEVVVLPVQLVEQCAVDLLHLQQDELDILELRDLRVAVAMVHGLRARAR